MPTLPDHTAQLRELLDLDNARRPLKPKSNAFAEATAQINALRGKLPTALLSHYDARRSRGKVPVAAVINGVCRACHLSLPSGRISDLHRGSGVQICENCGAFVYLPDEEAWPKPEAVAATAGTKRKAKASTTASK